MIRLADILPLVLNNDIRIVDDENEEICLIRNDFRDILSVEFGNAEVTCIENQEEISNTVNIHIARVRKDEEE